MFRRLAATKQFYHFQLPVCTALKVHSQSSLRHITRIAPTNRLALSRTTSQFSTSCRLNRDDHKIKPLTYDPASYKNLAFYKFYTLPQARLEALREQLLTDFGKLGIVGRIYISKEGINAQVACPAENIPKLQEYHQKVLKPLLGDDLMDLNIGTEHGNKLSFRALHVRIRKQLVADGLDSDSYDITNEPIHLTPEEWHNKLIEYENKYGQKPVLIDMRNHYESNIGYFEGAITPDADTFRDSITAMNTICEPLPRDQEVFMYCTGGIRCTKAGAILQSASGFNKVYLVKGGITAYGRWIAEQKDKKSLFIGKNFTFDGRLGEKITDDVLGKCHISGPVLHHGTRAFIKEGDNKIKLGSAVPRLRVGKEGTSCELAHHRRQRAVEVLGEPGEVLKEWIRAGRELPPKVESVN
ncbi:hypothetical protein BDF20DRAFT_828806 [Mycotypha africana]|uniref:uncharacterized protein n=1 Tax=Mycotypha africana TaxID=64632 RepID=UPI002300842B|nr:uncharacterized protein BDF20DRAFT_828806 [Mycotypha africana]KAI8967883.1 hypothetical protein BDF20DRAFT_828806 [Mycotypha africana]